MTHNYSFGEDNPQDMPRHLFPGVKHLDYSSAIRADTARQNCSICPRYWYVDAYILCARCRSEFCFSAQEQRAWFEEHGFWIDSFARHCLGCRADLRSLKTIRKKYDALVRETMRGKDISAKRELADIIDQLYELGGTLPPRINENRRKLALVLEQDADSI
ncbi:MAG: hypothetical protein HKN19_12180 [Halioglobus sp.]|nr:hypothetical protein [Halioglobus sp.]